MSVRLRGIRLEDGELLYGWRSDPRIYRFMRSDRAPSLEEHRAWMADRGDGLVFAVEADGVGLVGMARLDEDPGVGWPAIEFGMYIGPEHQGKGYGGEVLELLKERARKDGYKRLVGEVRAENERAIRFYAGRGFASKWVEMECELVGGK